VRRSNSSFSMIRESERKRSVKTQMMIIRKEDSGRGTPKKTLRMTGQISDQEPAGRR
jgi:hypothetical protein